MVAVTGIVDKDVDGSETFLSLTHYLGKLEVVGDVERERERHVGVERGEVLHLGGVAGGSDDGVAVGR